jgi:hypothetical protein
MTHGEELLLRVPCVGEFDPSSNAAFRQRMYCD